MSSAQFDKDYRFLTTDDGSPTLDVRGESGEFETMHNRRGALAEGLYIYHEAMNFVGKHNWPHRYLSVGLGLGYNELILAAHLTQLTGVEESEIYLESYESEPWLRESFLNWVTEKSQDDADMPWRETYETILRLVSEKISVPATDVKGTLQKMYKDQRWVVHQEISETSQFTQKFSCILYDAYSSKTNPELWDQNHLMNLLTQAAAANCVFATYAATGNLNRALRENGFLLEERPGFSGKRESTFAIKLTPNQ